MINSVNTFQLTCYLTLLWHCTCYLTLLWHWAIITTLLLCHTFVPRLLWHCDSLILHHLLWLIFLSQLTFFLFLFYPYFWMLFRVFSSVPGKHVWRKARSKLPHSIQLLSLWQWLPEFVAQIHMFTRYFCSVSFGSSYSIHPKPNSSFSQICFLPFTYSSQRQGIRLKSSLSLAYHFQPITDSQSFNLLCVFGLKIFRPSSLSTTTVGHRKPNTIPSRIYSIGTNLKLI